MPQKNRAASLRGSQSQLASNEIRRAFSDAPPKDRRGTNRPESAEDTGAAPGRADINVPIMHTPGTERVEGLIDRARRTDVVSGGKHYEVTGPSGQGVQAELARTDPYYGSKVHPLTARLLQIHNGQRDVNMRAVELESAIGSITSDIHVLGRRVATLELTPERPSRSVPLSTHDQNLHEALRTGAANTAPIIAQKIGVSNTAPVYTHPIQDHFPDSAPRDAPIPPLYPQIPLDPSVDRFQGAPHNGAPQLITTATSSAPLPEAAALSSPTAETGPFAPGLEPVQTMLPPFARVVDYRRYRMNDSMAVPTASELRCLYKLKKQIDGFYPTLGTYTGLKPITLLGFLSTLKEAFEAYATFEAIAVRTLAYFLIKEAKDMYQAQVNPRALTGHEALEATWPYVIHALIRRYLWDDILQSAYDAVVRVVQGPNEDEVKFAQRVSDAARACCHVFQPMELVNSYVRGLHEATRERVQEQVRRLPQKERTSLVTVRQIAAPEGREQRALMRPKNLSTGLLRSMPRPVQPRTAPRNYALVIDPNEDSQAPVLLAPPPKTPTTISSYYEAAPVSHGANQEGFAYEPECQPLGDPVSVVEAAVTLDSIFMVNEVTKETLDGYNLDGSNILRPTEEIPDLTREQIGQAISVIPTDYWQLNCWSCRRIGHSTFTCPKLTVKQRIYLAYCYYVHHVRSNHILKEWFNQKREALQGKGPEPDPRLSDQKRIQYRALNRSAQPYGQRNGSLRRVHLIDEVTAIPEEAGEPPLRSFVGPDSTDEENEEG